MGEGFEFALRAVALSLVGIGPLVGYLVSARARRRRREQTGADGTGEPRRLEVR